MEEDFYGGKEEVRVVKLLLQDEEGEFLMLKKSSDYDWMADSWEQPGGKITDGEDRLEAAKREVKEETGLEIAELEDLVRIEIEDRKELVNCYVLFTDELSGELELEEEHQDHRWISKEEAPELEWHRNAAYILPVIEYLEEYRNTEIDYSTGRELSVVKLLIKNEDGKFLAMKKTPEDKIHSGDSYSLYGRMAGKWELPGGKFQGASGRFEAAKREIMEEVGIEMKEIKDVMREEVEEKNSVDTFIVFCDEWEGEPSLSKEHVDMKWVTAEQYKKMNWHQDAGYGYPPMVWLNEYID